MTTCAPSRTPALGSGRRAWTVCVMCAGVALVLAMVTIVNTALPALAAATGVSQTVQTWIVDVYTLVLAAVVLPAGALGDRYGRRGTLVLGFAVFALSCATPLFAETSGWLIAARALTGLGAGLIMPATLSIITASFPSEQRGRAIGIWAAVAGLGGLAGMVFAGLLLARFSWHSVFLAPAVFAAVLAIAALTVPDSREPEKRAFDTGGAVLSAAAIGALVFGILRAADLGWTSPVVLGGLVAGVALFAVFAWFETRRDHPLLDVRLFLDRAFATGSIAITVQFTAGFGALYAIGQYLQLVHGYTPLKAGLVLWPIAVSLFPGALVSPLLGKRFGDWQVMVAGLVVEAVGVVLLARLGPDSGYPALAIAACVLGGGFGLTTPIATTSILENLPPGKYGVGSAVNDATREIGAALGIALAGSVLSSGYSAYVHPSVATLPPVARDAAEGSLAGAVVLAERLGPLGGPLAHAARAAFTHAMWYALLSLDVVVVAGMLAVVTLRARRR